MGHTTFGHQNLKPISEESKQWLKAWALHYRVMFPDSSGGPALVGNIWDKDDARKSFRREAARYSNRLFDIAISATLTGKTGRLKHSEKFYWQHAINALADYLGVMWGVPPSKKAPPATMDEMKAALSWAFLEFWPEHGVDIWLSNDFESYLEPDID